MAIASLRASGAQEDTCSFVQTLVLLLRVLMHLLHARHCHVGSVRSIIYSTYVLHYVYRYGQSVLTWLTCLGRSAAASICLGICQCPAGYRSALIAYRYLLCVSKFIQGTSSPSIRLAAQKFSFGCCRIRKTPSVADLCCTPGVILMSQFHLLAVCFFY